MTGWTLNYILDDITLDFLMLVYNYGIKFEETKSIIFLNKYAEAISGKKKQISDKPDIKKFKRIYGNKIKTPNKKEK
jgi:hypothetical protein